MKKNDKFCASTSSDTNGSLRFRVHRGFLLVAALCGFSFLGVPTSVATEYEDAVLQHLNNIYMSITFPLGRFASIDDGVADLLQPLLNIETTLNGIDGKFSTANAFLTDIELHASDTAFNTEELWNIGSISDDIKETLNLYQPELLTIRTLLENMPQSMMDQLGPATLSDLEASLTAIETVLSQPPAVQVDVAISNDLSPDAIWEFEGQSSTEGDWDVMQILDHDLDLKIDHTDAEQEVEDVKTGVQNTLENLELNAQSDIDDVGALEMTAESSITSISIFETLKGVLNDLQGMASSDVNLVFLPPNTLSFLPAGLTFETNQIGAFTTAARWFCKIIYLMLAAAVMVKLLRGS